MNEEVKMERLLNERHSKFLLISMLLDIADRCNSDKNLLGENQALFQVVSVITDYVLSLEEYIGINEEE